MFYYLKVTTFFLIISSLGLGFYTLHVVPINKLKLTIEKKSLSITKLKRDIMAKDNEIFKLKQGSISSKLDSETKLITERAKNEVEVNSNIGNHTIKFK